MFGGTADGVILADTTLLQFSELLHVHVHVVMYINMYNYMVMYIQ